jgi:hypothetical protein
MLGYDCDSSSSNSASRTRHIEWLVIGNYLIDLTICWTKSPSCFRFKRRWSLRSSGEHRNSPGSLVVRTLYGSNPSDPPGLE